MTTNKEILQIKLGLNPYKEKHISELESLPKDIKDEFNRHWELHEDYALDKRTNIKWYKATDTKKYTYEEAWEEYGSRLPTKEEFEEAEKHGIRFILDDFEGRNYWSSSVYSNHRNVSWLFLGTNGYVSFNSRLNNYWGRCVSRPTNGNEDYYWKAL